MGNKKTQLIVMLSGFFIVVLIMFRDSFQPGKMLFGNDTITIYMAFAVFAKKMMMFYHSLPSWLPDIYMGMPMIGSSSLLYFYPTDFIFMLLPVQLQDMYVPDLIIHMFLAALGMYLFLKKLKLEKPAALFGASAIMISGYIISYVYAGHWNNIKAGALIPLSFYFAHAALEDKKLLHCLNTALMLALMMLATGMQIMAYTFMALIFYAGYYTIFVEKEKKHKIKNAVGAAICAAFILFFSAPQFIPSMQYTNLSWRGDVSYQQFISWSFHPAELVTFLLPQFFGLFSNTYWGYMPFTLTTYYFGAIPFLLLCFLAVPGKNKKQVIFFSAAAAVFLVFAFGGYTFIYNMFYYLPVFKQFRNPSRFLYLVTFFVITLASVGLNNITESKDEKKSLKIFNFAAAGAAGFVLVFALLLVTGLLEKIISASYLEIKKTAMPADALLNVKAMIGQDLISLFLVSAASLAALFLLIKKKLKSVFLAAFILAAVNFYDVYRIDSKFITFEDYARFVPAKSPIVRTLEADKDPYRTANLDQVLGLNRNIYYGIENLGGMHGLMPAAYKQMENAKVFNNININRQFNIKYYMSGTPIVVPGFTYITENAGVMLYKDEYAKNRVFYSDNLMRLPSIEGMLDFMNSNEFNGQQVAIGPDFPDNAFVPGGGAVLSGDYSPSRVKVSAESASGGIVVHASGYYPQWKAKIDGKEAKVYRVNYYSMAVIIPAGRHEVEFYYTSFGIYLGLLIAAIAFMFYGFILFKHLKAGK